MSDVNRVWTPGGASLTGGADPDGVAVEYLVLQSHMNRTNEPVRENIHSEGNRATASALFTLETCRYFLTG